MTSARSPDPRREALKRTLLLLDVNWRRFAWATFLGSVSLGSAVGLTAISAWLIARASQMPPVLQLSVAVVAVRAFGISRGVFRYLERLVSHDVALRGMTSLRENLYLRLATGRIEAVAGLKRGELLARVGADVDAAGDLVVRALLPAAVAASVSLGSVVLVTAILPAAGLTLLACLAVGGVIAPWLSARAARTQELRTAEARAQMTAVSLELLEGAGPLTVSGAVEERLGALRASDRALSHATNDGAQTAGLAAAVGMAALGAAVLAALWFGIPEVAAGTLAPVRLPIIVLVPLAAFEALVVLPAAAVQLHRSGQAALRIADLLDRAAPEAGELARSIEPTRPVPNAAVLGDVTASASTPSAPMTRSSITSRDAAAPLLDPSNRMPPETRSPPAAETAAPIPPISSLDATTAQTTLVARNLACGWPGRPLSLEGVDLVIQPGRAIALVGASGVGKTTLLMTLAGLLPPRGGTLQLDGSAIAPSGDEDLRAATFFSAEDAHVFETTVFENLRVARGDLERAEASRALHWAGLTTWLEALPEGLDTPLGPDGSSISGGERRRLLLARATLSRAPFLFVDEPAEHLDPRAADALVTAIISLAKPASSMAPARAQTPRGVVVATHRLSALEAADEVLVLGRSGSAQVATVVARGTHAELLETSADYRWAVTQELA